MHLFITPIKTRYIFIFFVAGIFLAGIFGFVKKQNFVGQSVRQERTSIETTLGIPAQNSSPITPTKTAPPTQTATKTPASNQAPQINEVLLDIPFTPQAPLGKWSDPRQENGCEEAGALMAVSWAEGKTITPQYAEQQIIAISNYEQQTYGGYHDTSVQDTITRIYKGYFHYDKVEAKYNITADDIKAELSKGNLVVVPTNGQKLNNPYYVSPGPLQHELVIKGYDDNTQEFITNDSGTRRGNSYRYHIDVVMNAIYNYSTGSNEPIGDIVKAMIVVSR